MKKIQNSFHFESIIFAPALSILGHTNPAYQGDGKSIQVLKKEAYLDLT